MKASKPNVNVTRGSKTKTQGKKAEYKKDECAASGGNRPEVRKKGDGGPRAIGPDIVEPSYMCAWMPVKRDLGLVVDR
ncbi:hypothetical protein S83_027912 [Arachis hypogaea]